MNKCFFNALFTSMAVPVLVLAQAAIDTSASTDSTVKADEDNKWDVTVAHVPSDTLRFPVSEGTWMSVDVHPNGKEIAFDLLGDIYTMPIEGGEGRLLAGGLAYEVQPRYSPDGKMLLFTSDRGGGNNLWTMDVDGSNMTAITEEDYRLLNNGVWHPSGDYVVGRKHYTSERSIGAGEMWMYRVPGGGSGVQLTKRKNDQQDAGEPAFSPDGKYLYWSEDMSGGDYFEYNKDPNGYIYWIRRLELETNEIRNIVRINGGAARPEISPDGRKLAFVRRVRTRSVLSLFDLETGEIQQLWDGLDHDQQETWAVFGVYPGYDWTPDGKSIVIWAQGKLWRVSATTGDPVEIPFTVSSEQVIARAVRFPIDVGGEKFAVKVIRWPQMTRNGRSIIFQALGYLWKQDIISGRRKRLTDQSDEYEFAPRLSPDGKQVVYTTWNDRVGGRVKTVGVGGGSARTVVERPGHYGSAALSPDNKWVVYHRAGSDRYRGRIWDEEPGIYLKEVAGRSEPLLVTREGNHPTFSHTGDRIYLQSREGDKAALVSFNRLGSDRRVHATSERAFDLQLSPDEKWLAFEELWQTYVAPFPPAVGAVEYGPKMKHLPVKKLSRDGGTYLNWSPDSKSVRWSLGPEFFDCDIDSLFAIVNETDSSDSAVSDPLWKITDLGWAETADISNTDLYITGGTILPMHDLSVINNGVVHVKGNRIVEVGAAGEITIPVNARVLDVTGKVIMPGLVDIHAHVGSSNLDIYAQQNWTMLANLAFGTTTIHDPSNHSQMIFADAEMVNAGKLLGPRIFSTGTILYGAEGDFKTVIDNYQDALSAVKRTAAWGAISVKSYMQPRRNQRQMVIKAGLEEGIMVVPEGGSGLHLNMTQLLDGHTTLEHAIPVAPLYEPELRLLSRFGTGYTPTFVVAYGGLSGERYWYQNTQVWNNERLANFVPRSVIDPRSRRREMAPDEEYHHFNIAKTAAEVIRRGGNVQIGSHGQLQGLAAHWEIWMIVQGGATNHEALRAATWMGARSIGLDGQLGSIQPGMLADLIVVDGSVLDDIRQSENITYTMINGRLYDAMTMDQLEPERKTLPPGPFTDEVTAEEARVGCLRH